jgi:hypothetical protein
MAGQIAGLAITISAASIVAMGFTPSMLVLVVATVVSAVFLTMMKESKMIQQPPAGGMAEPEAAKKSVDLPS